MMTKKHDRKSALHPACRPLKSSQEYASQRSKIAVAAIGEMYIICSKFGTKSFKDGSQDICKDIESNFRPVTGF